MVPSPVAVVAGAGEDGRAELLCPKFGGVTVGVAAAAADVLEASSRFAENVWVPLLGIMLRCG